MSLGGLLGPAQSVLLGRSFKRVQPRLNGRLLVGLCVRGWLGSGLAGYSVCKLLQEAEIEGRRGEQELTRGREDPKIALVAPVVEKALAGDVGPPWVLMAPAALDGSSFPIWVDPPVLRLTMGLDRS